MPGGHILPSQALSPSAMGMDLEDVQHDSDANSPTNIDKRIKPAREQQLFKGTSKLKAKGSRRVERQPPNLAAAGVSIRKMAS